MTRTYHHLICNHCEQPFKSGKQDAKFCSLACYGDSLRTRQTEVDRKEAVIRAGHTAVVGSHVCLLERAGMLSRLDKAETLIYDTWDGVRVIVGYR